MAQATEVIINGRYHLHNQLGQGGMGVVYRATDRLTGAIVALKRVTTPRKLHVVDSVPNVTTADLRLALAHEFRTLAGLRHPHIISVLDYGFDDTGQPFFTMNYLADAQTLTAAGQDQPLQHRVGLIRQLLQALTYLHRHDILHRDLKPENVLVNNGRVQVLDFGLAASKGSGTSSGGTYLYLAPEIWHIQPYTIAADLFAVGILAGQLLTGTHPFAPLDHAFLDRLLEAEPDLSGLDQHPDLAAVVARLLAKDPTQRYASAADTLAAFSAAVNQPLPAETAAIRNSYLQAAAFVGRQAEQQQLAHLLTQAQAGQGHAVLIGGESGVGKSRLLEELRIQALVDGFVVLTGQGIREGGLPFQLWRAPLRRLCLTPDLSPLAASVLLPLVPDLPRLLGREVPPAPELDGRATQQRLFATITQVFRQQTRPLLLLLEDLQWVAESLAPLTWLLRAVPDLPLLVVGTFRVEEQPDLPARFPQMTYLPLARLPQADVQTLCRHMLGVSGSTPELVAFLQQQSEGNTFFLVEVVRALADQAGRLDEIGQMALPESVFPAGLADVLTRRLALVPPPAQPLLHLAALVGRDLDLTLLRRLAGDAVNLDTDWLPPLAAAGLLAVNGSVWHFAHDKLREGLQRQLDLANLQAGHRRVAQALEAVYPNDPSRAGDLMRHWHTAGEMEKACRYAQQAARFAQDQYANQDALNYWQQAEQLLPDDQVAQRCDVYLAQEAILHRLGRREDQRAKLNQLQAIRGQLETPAQGEIRLRQTSYALAISDYNQAFDQAQDLIAFGQQHDETRWVIMGHYQWAEGLCRTGKYEAASTHYQTALQFAQTAQALPQITACFNGLARVVYTQGAYDIAQQYVQQALTIARQIGDHQQEGDILNLLSGFVNSKGDHNTSRQYLQQALTISQKIGDRRKEGIILGNFGLIYIQDLQYKVARRYLEQALVIAKESDAKRETAIILNYLGTNAYMQGDLDTAQRCYAQALPEIQEIGLQPGEGLTHLNLGAVALARGDYDIAQQHLKKALAIVQQIGHRHLELRGFIYLGDLFRVQHQLAAAAATYEQALRLARELQLPNKSVEVRAGLSQVYLAQGHRSRAEAEVAHSFAHLYQDSHLDSIEDKPKVFHLVWQTLRELGQLAKAAHVLSLAAETIQTYLDKNPDPELQAMYLRQPHHQALWQAWQAKQGKTAPPTGLPGYRLLMKCPWTNNIHPKVKSALWYQSITRKEMGVLNTHLTPMTKQHRKHTMKSIIVVVEDDDINRELLNWLLIEDGWQVAVANDGCEGIKKVMQLRPEVVLMNVLMPGINGIAASQRLHREPVTRAIPIVLYSGISQITAEKMWGKAKATDYFEIPFDFDQLLSRLHQMIPV